MRPKANQAPRRIPPDVREEANWLYTRLTATRPHTLSHLKQALDNNSFAISHYFRQSWGEFLTCDGAASWSAEDKRRAEKLLEVLEILREDTRKPDLTIFLDKAERQALSAYCLTHNISRWEAISIALKRLCEEPAKTE